MPDIELIFPPEEENIVLEFPTNGGVDIKTRIGFGDISGTLPLSRTTGKLGSDRLDGIMTASEAHEIWNNA